VNMVARIERFRARSAWLEVSGSEGLSETLAARLSDEQELWLFL
jgi:hypothetical protein